MSESSVMETAVENSQSKLASVVMYLVKDSSNLSLRQLAVLLAVSDAGAKAKLSTGDVATMIGFSKPSVTRALDGMEDLITRTVSNVDKRRIEIRLTTVGKDAVKRLSKAV